MTISVIQFVRRQPSGMRPTDEAPGAIEDIRANAWVVIGLPILLLLIGLGCNYWLEGWKLSNAMELERFKVSCLARTPSCVATPSR